MAQQFELVDPIGRSYDLQPGRSDHNSGFSVQIFEGREPLWDRASGQNRYESSASYYQFDGGNIAGDRQFERANDYRNPQNFDSPYTHLQNAHQTASRYGAQAAVREYGAAIAAADRIDQRQVSRDLERNDRALMLTEERMMRADMNGASPQEMRTLQQQRMMLERRQQFLDNLRMAPVYARANAAFCFIAKGNNNLSMVGDNLLRQAIEISPEIEGNFYFNEHRNRAFAERNRRMFEEQRRYDAYRQPQRGLGYNPYEPQVPPVYNPQRQPEQLRPVQPVQPVLPQRPPERIQPVQPIQPVPPQRPPERIQPVQPVQPVPPQRPREQIRPVQPVQPIQPIQPVNPERPPAQVNPERTEAPAPVQRFDLTLLSPSGDVYSPAGPPGLGESAAGEAFSSEKDGKGGWDIDWRELKSKTTDSQGATTYKYEGEIDDSNGWILGLDGDTNFTAEETISSTGQLIKRVLTYDGSLTYKVKTDAGPRELQDVQKITTTYSESAKKFMTEIECSTGAIYKAETDLTGKVTKFTEVQTKPSNDAPGVEQANVAKFNHNGDVYHVARPLGIGGANPGWAGSDNDILDWRETQVARASNGNVTYKYKGEIEDSSGWTLNLNGDTNFEAQEIIDTNNNLVSSFIKYESAKDIKFAGLGGQSFSVSNVVQVRTNREANGTYVSTITDESGAKRTVKFKADGTVTEVN